ncbi:MAG: T9SS type A sorting domain-containing protein [bacterium]|nr:T9SS type A sorting domain-containing protein [bacterium]
MSPNPFNPSAEISFETSASGPLALEIFDMSGRRLGARALGSFGPGVHRVRWDGRDGAGTNVSSGMYLLRLKGSTAESQAMKVLLLR